MNKKALLLFILGALAVSGVALVCKGIFGQKQPAEATQSQSLNSAGPGIAGAKKLIAQSDIQGAIKKLELFIEGNPLSPQAESAHMLLGMCYESNGELLKARDEYKKTMEKFPASDSVQKIQEAIDNVNMKIIFSRIVSKDSFLYEVQKGDSLSKIAKKFATTMDLIIKSNSLEDGKVRAGQKLKIIKTKFSIIVDKSQNILTLKGDNDVVKTYSVSTGKNSSTPAGNFKVTNRIVKPTWYTSGAAIPPEDPRNILGSRWLGISQKGYGIHGTTDPQSIGQSVTAGCVRMINSDVEELYTIIPEGTEVIIID